MENFSSVHKQQKEECTCSHPHSLIAPFTDFSVPVQHIYLKLLIIEIKCYRWKKLERIQSVDPCHLMTTLLFPLPFQWTYIWISFSLSRAEVVFSFGFVCLLFWCALVHSVCTPLSGNSIPLLTQCPDLREDKGFIPVSML